METMTQRRPWYRRLLSSPDCVCWQLGSLALRLSTHLSQRLSTRLSQRLALRMTRH